MARPLDPSLRTRLLDAATRTFAERGYGATTIGALGAVAGVTKGGVYFHFRSKEELFFAALDHWRGALRDALDAAGLRAHVAADGAEALRVFLRGHLEFHFEHADGARLLRVLTAELGDRLTTELRGDVPQSQRDLRARLRELLARGGRVGSLFAGDPAFAAFVLASAVDGLVQQWLCAPSDAAPFCDAEMLAEALVQGYATGARAPRDVDGEGFRGPF